jgi:hypothetical protein
VYRDQHRPVSERNLAGPLALPHRSSAMTRNASRKYHIGGSPRSAAQKFNRPCGVDQDLSEAAVPKAESASRPAPLISPARAPSALLASVARPRFVGTDAPGSVCPASMMPRTLPSGATSNVLTGRWSCPESAVCQHRWVAKRERGLGTDCGATAYRVAVAMTNVPRPPATTSGDGRLGPCAFPQGSTRAALSAAARLEVFEEITWFNGCGASIASTGMNTKGAFAVRVEIGVRPVVVGRHQSLLRRASARALSHWTPPPKQADAP